MRDDLDVTEHTPFHRSREQLLAGVENVRQSPRDAGVLELVVVRPGRGERLVRDVGTIDVELGILGDTWAERGSNRTADGGPNRDAQITVMSSRAVDLVAASRGRWPLAGDQLYVDLDLSLENLPTGTVLGIGGARLEVTAAPHTGCAKFAERFGVEALRITATPDGRVLRLRGINTRVLTGGDVRSGDVVTVDRPGASA